MRRRARGRSATPRRAQRTVRGAPGSSSKKTPTRRTRSRSIRPWSWSRRRRRRRRSSKRAAKRLPLLSLSAALPRRQFQ